MVLVLCLILAAFGFGWGAYCVLDCIGWASTRDTRPPDMFDSLEPRNMSSSTTFPVAIAPCVPGGQADLLMGPNIVGKSKGNPHKDPAPPPPVQPPPIIYPTIIDLADPTDIGQKYYFSGFTLWGGGPMVTIGKQVGENDCWWIAALKSEALANPMKLTESATDDPRGGWDVKLYGQWYHIQDGFPWFGDAPTDGAMYPAVFNKAFAAYKGSYAAALGPGWPTTEIYAIGGGVDGSGWQAANAPLPTTDADLMYVIDTAHANNIGLTIATGSQTSWIVASHAYTIIGYTNTDGFITYQILNPWMIDGGNLQDSNPNDGLVTLTLAQFKSDVVGIVKAQ